MGWLQPLDLRPHLSKVRISLPQGLRDWTVSVLVLPEGAAPLDESLASGPKLTPDTKVGPRAEGPDYLLQCSRGHFYLTGPRHGLGRNSLTAGVVRGL